MESTASALCTLIAYFRAGDVSVAQLLRNAGVVDEPSLPDRGAVAKVLSSRPELVESWMQWSQDKRVSSGWYISPRAGSFVVGHYPEGPELSFQNKVDACAEFVIREAEAIVRDLRSNTSLERTRER